MVLGTLEGMLALELVRALLLGLTTVMAVAVAVSTTTTFHHSFLEVPIAFLMVVIVHIIGFGTMMALLQEVSNFVLGLVLIQSELEGPALFFGGS